MQQQWLLVLVLACTVGFVSAGPRPITRCQEQPMMAFGTFLEDCKGSMPASTCTGTCNAGKPTTAGLGALARPKSICKSDGKWSAPTMACPPPQPVQPPEPRKPSPSPSPSPSPQPPVVKNDDVDVCTMSPCSRVAGSTGVCVKAADSGSHGYNCECKEGCKWNPASKLCDDVDACNPINPCTSLARSTGDCADAAGASQPPYVCACSPGYSWNPENRTCDGCGKPPSSLLPSLNAASWGSCDTAAVGATCIATCAANHDPGSLGAPTATCQPNGDWTVTSNSCKSLGCVSGPTADVTTGAQWQNAWPAECAHAKPGYICQSGCTSPPVVAESDRFVNVEGDPNPSATCQADGSWEITGQCVERPGCFSGDTLVVIKESGTPVAMRDVRTGQHLQCVDSGTKLATPGEVSWCEVRNWGHVVNEAKPAIRISYQKPGGAAGSFTVTRNHLVTKLLTETPATTLAQRVSDFGPSDSVKASKIQPGDKTVALADAAEVAAGFVIATVTTSELVEADGLYLPAVEMPYIIADGAVVPLWVDFGIPVVSEAQGNAVLSFMHYLAAPFYMKKQQPDGVPATSGQWDGNPLHPGITAFGKLAKAKVMQGLAINHATVYEWWAPRYSAWKENPEAALAWEAALDALSGPEMWVQRQVAAGSVLSPAK